MRFYSYHFICNVKLCNRFHNKKSFFPILPEVLIYVNTKLKNFTIFQYIRKKRSHVSLIYFWRCTPASVQTEHWSRNNWFQLHRGIDTEVDLVLWCRFSTDVICKTEKCLTLNFAFKSRRNISFRISNYIFQIRN